MTGRKDVQKKERKEGISTNRKRKGKEPISNQHCICYSCYMLIFIIILILFHYYTLICTLTTSIFTSIFIKTLVMIAPSVFSCYLYE